VWVVSTTPRPIYLRERPGTHCTGGWVSPRACLDRCEKLAPTGNRSADRPARSHPLYRLSYRAHNSLRGRLNLKRYYYWLKWGTENKRSVGCLVTYWHDRQKISEVDVTVLKGHLRLRVKCKHFSCFYWGVGQGGMRCLKWFRVCATCRVIAGSNPDSVYRFFHCYNLESYEDLHIF
jgi:hypothetical protein